MEPSKRDIELIEFAASEYHTLEEIGQRFGITRERVRQVLGRHGVTRPDPTWHETARRMRESGSLIREIAQAVNLHPGTVHAFLHSRGIKSPHGNAPSMSRLDARRDDLLRMHAAGATQAEMGVEVGVWPGTIARWLLRNGLQSVRQRPGWENGNPNNSLTPTLDRLSADADYIIARYRDGASLNALANEFNCAATSIVVFIESRGEKVRGRSYKAPARIKLEKNAEWVLSEYKRGRTCASIARELNISQPLVARLVAPHRRGNG